VLFCILRESNEESLPLVYGILLKITIGLNQCLNNSSGEDVEKVTKKFLLSYAQHLMLVGDDKQGWGLLGALGIGKTSQLSIRYFIHTNTLVFSDGIPHVLILNTLKGSSFCQISWNLCFGSSSNECTYST